MIDVNDYQLFDVQHQTLSGVISTQLKQKYLKPYRNTSAQVKGVLYGNFGRPIVCLPVKKISQNEEISQELAIHFIVDTGSPITCLSEQALMALHQVNDIALVQSTSSIIWGVKIASSISQNHWQGINLLGSNFLRKCKGKFEVFYSENPNEQYCLLKKQ